MALLGKLFQRLPKPARRERQRDRASGLYPDPGPEAMIDACAHWLALAQDRSLSADGGIARHYSLLNGWATSYPETSGYIVPTLFDVSKHLSAPEYEQRALRALNWLVSIQLPGGGFQGGKIDASPIVPVTFNTGQILLGLAAGVARHGGTYRDALHAAATWLRDSQDADGAWRRHPTPFAVPGEKAYETHVAWGLFEAERVAPGEGYGDAGLRQVHWALGKQQPNGWVADCCLNDTAHPLTHTLGYFLKGLVEAHRLAEDTELLDAALRTARGLLGAQRPDGSLPGRLDSGWRPAVRWSCLTGNVQIAQSWLYLAEACGDESLHAAARRANRFVRQTVALEGPPETRGGVKGSFPVDGEYGHYEYLSWAAKFTIDSNQAELAIRRQLPCPIVLPH